jgi:hypothetical protein
MRTNLLVTTVALSGAVHPGTVIDAGQELLQLVSDTLDEPNRDRVTAVGVHLSSHSVSALCKSALHRSADSLCLPFEAKYLRASTVSVDMGGCRGCVGGGHDEPSTIEHMGLDHRGFHISVTKKFLNGANIVAGLEQVAAKQWEMWPVIGRSTIWTSDRVRTVSKRYKSCT